MFSTERVKLYIFIYCQIKSESLKSLLINSILQNSYTLYGVERYYYMPYHLYNDYRYVLNQQAIKEKGHIGMELSK